MKIFWHFNFAFFLFFSSNYAEPELAFLHKSITDFRRRQWHPTPVLLPEKTHGWRSLESCGPWGHWGSDMTDRLHFHFHALEKEMATHSSVLAWKIPWMEEPGRLQSMGSLRVGHDWATSLSLFTFMHWRRKWQLTPVFLPGESQGRESLVGCRLWGHTELDTTEVT